MLTTPKTFNIWHIIIIVSAFLRPIKSNVDCNKRNESISSSEQLIIFSSFLTGEGPKLYFDYFEPYLNFSSEEISPKCRDAVNIVKNGAKNFEINSLKLLDANSRLSSGILSGNINNFGDFNECLETKFEAFQGKYCLADIQFRVGPHLQHFKDLILSNEPYRNEFDDIVHIIPRTSTVLWGICAPSVCSHEDVEAALKTSIDENFGKFLKSSQVKVTPQNCQTNEKSQLTFGTKLTIAAFSVLLVISTVSSIYDVFASNQNEFLIAFSIKKNFKVITSTETSPSEISSLNGIRFVFALLIVIGHKCMAICALPVTNKLHLSDIYASNYSILSRSMFLFTEIFLMLSGLLLAHSMLGKLNRGLKISIRKEIAARYIRFMPPVVALMLFSTFVLPLIGSGPMWHVAIGSQAEICKSHGWKNLLMIQNWFGFENICNFNLHHIGTDFIIFVALLPIIVYLHKFPRYQMMIVIGLGGLSTIGRFYISSVVEMGIYTRFRTSVQELMNTANYMYGLPPYRFTSYAIGFLLGYVLRNQEPKKLNPKVIKIGWFLAIISMTSTAVLTTMVHVSYSRFNMALVAAFTPILFCTFFAWVIYLCHHQSGNKFTRFFEWKYFKILSNLSYALYLIQFQVFSYNVVTAHSPIQYSVYYHMFDLNEFLVIIIWAVIMTLLVELPFGNIKKLIFDQEKSKKSSEIKSE